MIKRYIEIPNFDFMVKVCIYECNKCGIEIDERDNLYWIENNNIHYCKDCAFKLGKIDSKTYLNGIGINVDHIHAAINPNGEIELWSGKEIPPWERTEKRQRKTAKYSNWRTSVFERDDYTCQKCGQVGGELNAHHIKHFSKYPKKRFDLNNGITLCLECHKEEHRN